MDKEVIVRVAGAEVECSVMRTEEELALGLQGHNDLSEGEGMLFLFPRPKTPTFWMGKVAFPIDIVGIDENSRITKIVEDAQPGTTSRWTFHKVRAVLEVPGGWCLKNGVKLGQSVEGMDLPGMGEKVAQLRSKYDPPLGSIHDYQQQFRRNPHDPYAAPLGEPLPEGYEDEYADLGRPLPEDGQDLDELDDPFGQQHTLIHLGPPLPEEVDDEDDYELLGEPLPEDEEDYALLGEPLPEDEEEPYMRKRRPRPMRASARGSRRVAIEALAKDLRPGSILHVRKGFDSIWYKALGKTVGSFLGTGTQLLYEGSHQPGMADSLHVQNFFKTVPSARRLQKNIDSYPGTRHRFRTGRGEPVWLTDAELAHIDIIEGGTKARKVPYHEPYDMDEMPGESVFKDEPVELGPDEFERIGSRRRGQKDPQDSAGPSADVNSEMKRTKVKPGLFPWHDLSIQGSEHDAADEPAPTGQSDFVRVSPDEFEQALVNSGVDISLIDTTRDYNNMRLFVSKDGSTGYGIKNDGEAKFLFSSRKGGGAVGMRDALSRGGHWGTCFDGHLPRFYARFDMHEIGRAKNWNPGEPDVVLVGLDPSRIPEDVKSQFKLTKFSSRILASKRISSFRKAGYHKVYPYSYPRFQRSGAERESDKPARYENDQVTWNAGDYYRQMAKQWGEFGEGPSKLERAYDYLPYGPQVDQQVAERGYDVYYAGGRYGKPDLAQKNYNTGHIMIYDPTAGSGGDSGDTEYTRVWRIAHELAHAEVYPLLNEMYGEGRRIGKLGFHRTLREAKRAVHWEWLAAHKQRELAEEMGLRISDAKFNEELNGVIHDAVHRAVTGLFTNPMLEGFVPSSRYVPLKVAFKELEREAARLGLPDDDSLLTPEQKRQLTKSGMRDDYEDFGLTARAFKAQTTSVTDSDDVDEEDFHDFYTNLTRQAAEKSDGINFKPPKGARDAAQAGLNLRKEYGRGGTAVGIARARDIARGATLSRDTVKRMKAFFDRHQKNRGSGSESPPKNGWIAWQLWGGDAGRSWANKVVRQMESREKKKK